MAAISMDLRVRILEARQSGDETAEVAERFAVSPAFVRRLMQRHRQTGSLAPNRTRRGPRPRLDAASGRIAELLARCPGLTPAEVRDRLGLAASPVTVWRAMKRLGLTFKKSPSALPSRTARRSGRRARGGRRRSPAGRRSA